MENKTQQSSGSSPPKKPWERAGPSSGAAPFKPSSAGKTSDVVEASGTAQPGEVVSTGDRNTILNRNTVGRPVPTRPWEQQTYGSTYGGSGSGLNYNSGYGTGMNGSSGLYGSSGMYGTSGGSYGSGLYGNSMYGGGYGGLYGGAMNGGGMYNSGFGGPMGGYGVGMGGPYGEQDPNNPYGAPSSPPGFWISLMRVMHGVVNFCGRVAMLIDQNTQAFHMFMTALLQVFDRSGLLYGELARFVLRLLGIKTKPKNAQFPGVDGLPGPHHPHAPGHLNPHASQNYIEGPKAAPNSEWDGAWGNDTSN